MLGWAPVRPNSLNVSEVRLCPRLSSVWRHFWLSIAGLQQQQQQQKCAVVIDHDQSTLRSHRQLKSWRHCRPFIHYTPPCNSTHRAECSICLYSLKPSSLRPLLRYATHSNESMTCCNSRGLADTGRHSSTQLASASCTQRTSSRHRPKRCMRSALTDDAQITAAT